MRKYFKGVLYGVCLLGAMSIIWLPMVYCQQEALMPQEPSDKEVGPAAMRLTEESISGEIISIDLEKYKITLKVLQDEATHTYEDKAVMIDTAIIVDKNNAALGIANLHIGDRVSVECLRDEGGEISATSLTVVQTKKK